MNKLACILIAFAMIGCHNGNQGPAGAPGATGPQGPTAPAPTPTAIQAIVDSENAYREAQGEAPLTQGLSCSVVAVGSGGFLSTSSPNYVAATCTANPLSQACAIVTTGPSYSYLLSTAFDQPNSGPGPNNVIDPAIQALFETNNYRVICNGALVVTEDGYYGFSLSSDDGSILVIDGTTVISNDGSHGIATASGTKLLESAVTHTFQLQYAQSGAGNFALVLDMNGSLLPAANLYH